MNAISRLRPKALDWLGIVSLTLALWLGASLLLDLVVMPCLYQAGMLQEPAFVDAGYQIFGIFNRVEVLCAAVVMSGFLGLEGVSHKPILYPRVALVLAGLLLVIPLAYVYAITPYMSALGLSLDQFAEAEIPVTMSLMHASYWLLELIKVAAIGSLLGISQRTVHAPD
jgi:hypothetical protein